MDCGGGGPAEYWIYRRYSICVPPRRFRAYCFDCGLVRFHDRGTVDAGRDPEGQNQGR